MNSDVGEVHTDVHIATMKAVIALSSNFAPRYRGVEKLGEGGGVGDDLILRGTWCMKLLR